MNTRVDDRLRLEARRFRFRFACEDCAHREGGGASLRCTLGYPAAPRLEDLAQTQLSLCKSFELA